MIASFAISEGCTLKKPKSSQRWAPFAVTPTNFKINNKNNIKNYMCYA